MVNFDPVMAQICWRVLGTSASQYGELWSSNGSDLLASFGHLSKFQRVSRLGLVTAPYRRLSMEVNQTLHEVWQSPGLVHYIYILGLLSPNWLLPGATFLLQVLCSPILVALVHGTQAVGVSQTLRHGTTRNGIMELLLLVIFKRGRHLYS